MLKEKLRENKETLIKLLPLISFITPLLILYLVQDVTFRYSFEATWKGRAFYIFFIWFAVLEMIVSWEKLQLKAFKRPKYVRTIALILALSLPTIYVVVSNFYGLNEAIYEWSKSNRIAGGVWGHIFMPLSIEYLAFAAFFFLIVFLQYGACGFRRMSLAPSFLATMGIIYMIDNLYPYGQFTPFQIPAAATAILAETVLNFMGYRTSLSYSTSPETGWVPVLKVTNPQNPFHYTRLGVAWPCSGVESLIIYTLFMIIFLKNFEVSTKRKIIYFVAGATVTYLINIARVVSLFIIALKFGPSSINPLKSQKFENFHSFYGPLYSIIWITLYPILIMVGGNIWRKVKSLMKTAKTRLFSRMAKS